MRALPYGVNKVDTRPPKGALRVWVGIGAEITANRSHALSGPIPGPVSGDTHLCCGWWGTCAHSLACLSVGATPVGRSVLRGVRFLDSAQGATLPLTSREGTRRACVGSTKVQVKRGVDCGRQSCQTGTQCPTTQGATYLHILYLYMPHYRTCGVGIFAMSLVSDVSSCVFLTLRHTDITGGMHLGKVVAYR
jgi:hypothetical protein